LGEPADGRSVAEATATATAAQADLDQLRAISRALGQRELAVQDDLRATEAAVLRCIPPVIRAELVEFGARVAAARQLLATADELNHALPPGSMPEGWDIHPDAPPSAAWCTALAALENDPDGRVPAA
jgi:hypothetical protein